MAISITYAPSQYARVYDTNVCTYKIHSSSTSQFNFTFLLQFYVDGVYIASQKFNADVNGDCYINPTSIYKNYLSPTNQVYDFSLTTTGLTNCTNSMRNFQMYIQESYGVPTTLHNPYTGATIYFYNGVQQFVDYQSTAGGGNLQWVMTGSSSGNYLCDVTRIYLGKNDYYNLYFINPPAYHISKVRYSFYYPPGGGQPSQMTNQGGQYGDTSENQSQALIKGDQNFTVGLDAPLGGGGGIEPWPPSPTGATIYFETAYNPAGSYSMFYIPIGVQQIIAATGGPGNGVPENNYYYYWIDLYSGTTRMNKNSFFVYNVERDCRYPNYQVFWLNKHGGFDSFVWDKGNVVKNKIKRDTYKKSLQPNYPFTQAGELIHSIDVSEELTLTTSLLESQTQSQMIIGMFQSPCVFVLQKYNGVPFAVPYIVVDTEVEYLQMINDQSIYYTCTLRPSNTRLEQTY